MSEWHEIKNEDISIEPNGKTVDMYVTSNDQGSVYATLTFDQIAEILKTILDGYGHD